MKNRILNNWTFRRFLYLGMGVAIIIQAVMVQEWLGAIFGGYFASMGLFAFGCASGKCYGGSCETEPNQMSNMTHEEVKFEELKTK